MKRALVTGASEGIGRAFAHALARRGYTVVAIARNEVRLRALLDELGDTQHEYVVADLATEAGVHAAEAALTRTHCDLLINNAGAGAVGAFDQLPLERHVSLLRLNVEALVVLSHAFLRQAQPGDSLVNISSILGVLPQPAQPVYAATKAFVTSFTESLWQKARGRGVRVLGVHPGATESQFGARAGRDPNRRRPSALVQTAEAVAEEALRALEAGRGPSLFTGLHNRLIAAVARLVPRRILLAAMDRAGG